MAMPTMLLTYKYRLNPEKRQHLALERILEQQRQLYNAALEERIEAYRRCGRTISEFDQSRSLTIIRADDPAFPFVAPDTNASTCVDSDKHWPVFRSGVPENPPHRCLLFKNTGLRPRLPKRSRSRTSLGTLAGS